MSQSDCSSAQPNHCAAASCHWRCALGVIDELLAERDTVTGAETDLLLELRWQLGKRANAEETLRLFCDLRRRLETAHYLACFRIRRWLENHLLAKVRLAPGREERLQPIKLDYYCVEAIRRASLCSALAPGATLLAPRIQFHTFRPLPTPIPKTQTSELTEVGSIPA